MITNDQARELYTKSGISYSTIYDNIETLKYEVERALQNYAANGGMAMTLSNKETRPRFKKNTREIECFFLRVDGPYFKDREAISFNPDGFVGFAGWADSKNVTPFLHGFLETLSIIERRKI